MAFNHFLTQNPQILVRIFERLGNTPITQRKSYRELPWMYVGIGIGLTEFVGPHEMVAKYHTMIGLSFEQTKKLADSLNELLLQRTNFEKEHEYLE